MSIAVLCWTRWWPSAQSPMSIQWKLISTPNANNVWQIEKRSDFSLRFSCENVSHFIRYTNTHAHTTSIHCICPSMNMQATIQYFPNLATAAAIAVSSYFHEIFDVCSSKILIRLRWNWFQDWNYAIICETFICFSFSSMQNSISMRWHRQTNAPNKGIANWKLSFFCRPHILIIYRGKTMTNRLPSVFCDEKRSLYSQYKCFMCLKFYFEAHEQHLPQHIDRSNSICTGEWNRAQINFAKVVCKNCVKRR